MTDRYSFCFVDDEPNQKLIARAAASRTPHEVESDGTLRYSADDEDAIDEHGIRPIRQEVFPRWQVLNCPPEWAARYRQYMEQNGLPFREERIDGEIAFLIPRDVDPHRWDLKPTAALRAR